MSVHKKVSVKHRRLSAVDFYVNVHSVFVVAEAWQQPSVSVGARKTKCALPVPRDTGQQ